MAPESFPGHEEVVTLRSSRLANGAPEPGRREFSDCLVALVIVVNHNRLSVTLQLCRVKEAGFKSYFGQVVCYLTLDKYSMILFLPL